MSLREAFRAQSTACAALGSPFMGRLMKLFAERFEPGTSIADRAFDWPGDPSISADNVPLRLAGALHALKLNGIALTEVYPPEAPDDETLWHAVAEAMERHTETIHAWLDTPPQTNEVRRTAAILPALALLQENSGLPVDLLELGTSGGLNLRADKFRLELPGGIIGKRDAAVVLAPDWQGPMPPVVLPRVARRAGVDLSPLDPNRPEDALRLLAYVWADQEDRLTRTRAAIEVARTVPADISTGDAGDWLERELSLPAGDRMRVVVHTVAWQYFPEDTRARAEAAMAGADGPLARIAMEFDGGKGALVTLTIWPDETPRPIARADFHGRWVHWSGLN